MRFRFASLSLCVLFFSACTESSDFSPDMALDSDASVADAQTGDPRADAQADMATAPDMTAPAVDVTVFSATEVDELSDDELRVIDDAIGSAEFVALGEAAHTSGGLWALKLRVIRYLVEVRGFRVLAWEAPHGLLRDNEQAITNDCDLQLGLDSLQYEIWQSQENQDVLQWICDYNAAHASDPIRLMGFDVQHPWSERDEVERFLAHALPAQRAALVDGINASCDRLDQPPSNPNLSTTGWYSVDAYAHVLPCRDAIKAVRDAMRTNAAAVDAASTLEERAAVALALDALDYTMDWQQDNASALYQGRDNGMADVLLRQRAAFDTTGGTIVWAANSHISWRHEDIVGDDFAFQGARSMGSFVREMIGQSHYRPIALIAYKLYMRWPLTDPVNVLIAPNAADVIETTLHARNAPIAFVNAAAARAPGGAYADRGSYRVFVNGDFRYVELEKQFAGALFLDTSDARHVPSTR